MNLKVKGTASKQGDHHSEEYNQRLSQNWSVKIASNNTLGKLETVQSLITEDVPESRDFRQDCLPDLNRF